MSRCSSGTSSACRAAARSASTRASTAARRCSSRCTISAGAKGSNARSASGGPRQCLAQQPSRLLGAPLGQRPPAVLDETLEPLPVKLTSPHAQPVAGTAGGQPLVLAERAAQPRQVYLHRPDC